MRPGDRPERQNQHDQNRARRQGVAKQREGDVATRQPLAHNARPDDGRDQQPRAETFGGEAPGEGKRHAVATRRMRSSITRPRAGASRRHPYGRSRAPARDRHSVEAFKRQIGECRYSVLEIARGRHEGRLLLNVASLDGGGVLECPNGRSSLAGPDRAGLAGRAVANREHEIHHGRARRRKLFPTLGAHAEALKHFESEWIDGALGPASGRKGVGSPAPSLRKMDSATIERALLPVHQEQHVEEAFRHERPPRAGSRG